MTVTITLGRRTLRAVGVVLLLIASFFTGAALVGDYTPLWTALVTGASGGIGLPLAVVPFD